MEEGERVTLEGWGPWKWAGGESTAQTEGLAYMALVGSSQVTGEGGDMRTDEVRLMAWRPDTEKTLLDFCFLWEVGRSSAESGS